MGYVGTVRSVYIILKRTYRLHIAHVAAVENLTTIFTGASFSESVTLLHLSVDANFGNFVLIPMEWCYLFHLMIL